VFDTDGTFDIHRLQTLLRKRLPHNFTSGESATEQIITIALRNVHVFRPKSSPQLAAGLANLSSYHSRCLPTSEIALLAIDSARSFYWPDRFAAERAQLMNLATPPPTASNNPLQTTLTALWSFRRSHRPVIVILNSGPSSMSAAGNVPVFQRYKPFLPSFATLVERTNLFPDAGHDSSLFVSHTHQITLELVRTVPSSHNAEQGMVSLVRHIDVHVRVKTTAVIHTELLHMQISPEHVNITMADVAHDIDG
jgi:hypothetical protein